LISSIKSTASSVLSSTDAASVSSVLQDIVNKLEAFVATEETVEQDTSVADKQELERIRAELPDAVSKQQQVREQEVAAKVSLDAARSAIVKQGEQNHESERSLFEKLNQERELRQALVTMDTELQALERDRSDFKQELQEAVTLVGRGAMDYLSYAVVDATGAALTNEALLTESRDEQRERRRQLEKLKIRLEELGVGATEDLLKEYEDAKARDEFLAKELDDLMSSVNNLQTLIVEMDEQLHEQFVAGIDRIGAEFNRFFTLMFGGGSAELKRVQVKTRGDDDDENEPAYVNEGVELAVALPNKRVKGLEMLSGGERALTSIALIFAMFLTNPSPVCVLDEIDAPLDDANVDRVCDLLDEISERGETRFIIVTHHRLTMARMDRLYGVTMSERGVSQLVSVDLQQSFSFLDEAA